MRHSVSSSEWITINMICNRPLQSHHNPITYGIFIFDYRFWKKMRGALYLTLQNGGGGIFTRGRHFTGEGGGGSLPTFPETDTYMY